MVENSPGALTFSGRFAHFGSTHLTTISRWQGRLHNTLYQRFNGTVLGKFMGRPVFQLTVPGRKSGEPRPVILMLVRDGDDLLVTGSFGGNPKAPNWWGNLVAAGGGAVRVGRESWPVTARVITDPAEYTAYWPKLVAQYPDYATYQALTTRKLPIAVLTRAS